MSNKSGKKKGLRRVEMQYIKDKQKRQTAFSKRKNGLMKKAFEIEKLTNAQIFIFIASETAHVYCFATPMFKPWINQVKDFKGFQKRETKNKIKIGKKAKKDNGVFDK